jgi:DNA-binding NarL/FixJ family response regulator
VSDQVSATQLEILKLVAEGLSNPEIGAKMSLSVSSVSAHLRLLFRRIGAKDRAHAVYLCLRDGVIE